jgi:hypothetical protein
MGRDPVQGYVAGLEQILQTTHVSLKETVVKFQELCQLVTPDRYFPQSILVEIRETYKEIQDLLRKGRGIQQLLQGKYRQYYRRDPLRDRDLTELGFVAQSCYFKFEATLQQIETQRRLRERERALHGGPTLPGLWFRSRENQTTLVRTLRHLAELDYSRPLDSVHPERRRVSHHSPRSLSLFVFQGEPDAINELQSRMRLREHDIAERYDLQELRGALAHLREMSLPEKERVVRRFKESYGLSKIKCLLFSIQSQKDLQEDVFYSTGRILGDMGEGEVKTLSVQHSALG